MRNKYIIILALLFFPVFRCISQVEWGPTDLGDRFPYEYSCSIRVDFPPKGETEVLEFLRSKTTDLDDYINNYCAFASLTISVANRNFEDHKCFYTFDRYYYVDFMCDDVPTQFSFLEHFHVMKMADHDTYSPQTTTADMFAWESGYHESDLPDEYTLEELLEQFPTISSSCGKEEQLELKVEVEEGEETPCEKEYIRTYTITDICTDDVLGNITENITLESELKIRGYLKSDQYTSEDDLPDPYTTLAELENAKARVIYSREKSELQLTYFDDIKEGSGRIYRNYIVSAPDCEKLSDTVVQLLKRKTEYKTPFTISYQDATAEGIDDGYLEIISPSDDEGCDDEPGNPNAWYRVTIVNQTTMEVRHLEFPETENIYVVDDLSQGDYTIVMYANCNSCEFPDERIYSDSFKIGVKKFNLYITPWLTLYSDHIYGDFYSCLAIDYGDNEEHEFKEYDETVARFTDVWEATTGYLYTPKKVEFNPNEAINSHMGGQGAMDDMLWHYNLFNNSLNHAGLQKVALTKDVTETLRYSVYLTGTDKAIAPPAEKNLYKAECLMGNDPNEIYGPEGYGDLKMVKSSNPLDYTIRFENDPEKATAAAARVKIDCPISDKADPTTFRLGSFGFSGYTFEVPELTSYYNQRIPMDSLGYWLDVTAMVKTPENHAVWIFQTIDPATGMAPADSLGFLPVNDTLTGCGEGFVNFTVDVIITDGGVHTGDSIMENAGIFFDENEVVPTNNYTNHFDAVAPTSHLVCDTTNAYIDKVLHISFTSADDEGGSGVKHIELYVNIDKTGYQYVNNVDPDSTYNYSLDKGTNFEFFGIAVDNVGNQENFKTTPELYYSLGNPPYDLVLSNDYFDENAVYGSAIGVFSTFDDQNSDIFQYDLVNGEGSNDNELFSIQENILSTHHNFICHGETDFSIRVRTTDITNAYLEKTFTLHMQKTEFPENGNVSYYICPGESVTIHGEAITTDGIFYDTISSYYGCDSVVCTRVYVNPEPTTTTKSDVVCYGYDYLENGFNLSIDSLASLTTGWTLASDTTLYLDNYVENVFGCIDTTRLALTLHPAYNYVDEVLACPTELPYPWQNRYLSHDTIATISYLTELGCDSTYTINFTVNPNHGTHVTNLNEGWNWYSTYIDLSNRQGLTELQNVLGTDAQTIKSQTEISSYNQGQWVGTLHSIDNSSMVVIQMNTARNVDLFGCFVDVANAPISLSNGWTWISYPVIAADYVSHAMTGLSETPSNNDVIKSQTQLTTYDSEYGAWFGNLTVMWPGQGYKYKSIRTTPFTLTYPGDTRGTVQEKPALPNYWVNDAHQHANNISFIGVVELDGNILDDDDYEVGVFCGEEQRGSGRVMLLEGPNIYRVFIVANGEDGEKFSFRLYDHDRNKERRIYCNQEVVFHADDNYGSIRNPYHFTFNTAYDHHIVADICEGQYYVENGFRVYESGTYFKELNGINGNDSIVRLDLTVNPVFSRESDLIAFDFPFHYESYTFDKPGTFTFHLESEHACDSTLIFNVHSYDGARELSISPVPAKKTDRVVLFFPFTNDEQNDLQVEVYTMAGSIIQSFKPNRFPIELDEIRTAGTYTVKITMGTGEIVTGKIIVE